LKPNPRNLPEEAAGFILVGDTLQQIEKKINKSFCEDGNVVVNPVLENALIVLKFQDKIKCNEVEYDYEGLKSAFE
jgi:hypothetical protein